MTVKEIANKISGRLLIDGSCDVTHFYCGDFLSRVMGKAPAGCGWLTVMNNLNVAGVAVMADIPLVIFCEDVAPAADLVARCTEEGIAIIATSLPVFECCGKIIG